ncbi:MAG: M1 family metallopeptidase [Rudaea sp.]|uniref:M1 family metallopeptidase n=1 Tax=unclassified Rudaea TaxID=2627037 RepID=UPI0014855BBB|nr:MULTISPECIES: M1 family metallopeptidase [unclassified Rudaea]MBN8886391.1 M1 family metallopeptidase [Rudaea sp.]
MSVLRNICSAVFACLSIVHLAAAAEAVPTGKLPDDAKPLAYVLDLKIDPRAERFDGKVRIKIKLAKPAEHVWLYARELDVAKVSLIDAAGKSREVKLGVRDPSGVVEVAFGTKLPAQDIELTFDYSAPFNAKLQGIYKVKVGDDAYVTSQMEAISARYAFPSFDEPRFKTPFDITLTVPADEVAIANTLQTDAKESADKKWKTLSFARTKPLPTYLVALAVGPWDVVDGPALAPNSVRNAAVPLRGVGPRGTGPQLKWILEQTPQTVKYYEDYTHQAYPFDKLDLLGAPDFSAGAMENAGLIVYRDALLRIDAKSPAASYRSSFNVNAHEIAHQWFGDLVTVPWWDDIWLNEAFATWAQGKATVALKPEYLGDLSRLESTLHAMQSDSQLSARKIRQPITDQGDIENAFDGITYQKGAAVLRMFEEWVGEDTYRDAMRDYLAKHQFGSGNSDDLIATIARVSGKGETLAKAMRSFLDQPGLPLVRVEAKCNKVGDSGKGSIELSQSRYLPYGVLSHDNLQWQVPVCARLGQNGKSSRQCFLLDQPKKEFALEGGCAQWVMPNAEAAGYYRFALDKAEFAALQKQVAGLAPAEQLVYADALSSAFEQGTIGPDVVLDAMPALANSDSPQIATALFGSFEWIREHLATDTTRPALDAYAAKLYAPRLAALGLHKRADDSDATTRLRVGLVNFLATVVRDKNLRAQLNAEARTALGLDGGAKADLGKLDPDIRGVALTVAVQDSGEPAYRAVQEELKTNRQTKQRYELLAALGATHDAKLGEDARNYGLTPAVAVGEIPYLYSGHVGEEENRAGFWAWLKPHFDTLVKRLPDSYQPMAISFAGDGRCGKAEGDEIREWFAPRIKDVIGGERHLAQTLEKVDTCAALREHVGDKALKNWAEAHPAR